MSESERERLPTEALLALQSGHKVAAVRIVREQTGLGLGEARALVERAERETDPEVPRMAAAKEDSGEGTAIPVGAISRSRAPAPATTRPAETTTTDRAHG